MRAVTGIWACRSQAGLGFCGYSADACGLRLANVTGIPDVEWLAASVLADVRDIGPVKIRNDHSSLRHGQP